ncbi:MAG: DUF1398 family protein [Bacteroidota bacterium]
MFTVEQIQQAHSKVKSGADFPSYIREIKTFGITYYETYVSDGHTDYFGANDYRATAPAKYAALTIANECDVRQFKADLVAHQQGQTSYLTFIEASAALGIEKWAVCMEKMTCTYYDKSHNEVLVEKIPS